MVWLLVFLESVVSPFLIRSALVLTAPRLTENDRGGEEISTLEALEAI